MNKNLLLITALLSTLFLIPNFIDYNINEDNTKITIHEKFDPSLTRLNSLAKLQSYTDSLASIKNILPGTLDYAVLANEVVSQRFYHKYATHSVSDNWIAAISEKITGDCLATNFTSDDILKKPYGYCVQVNTVLIELLKLKKYDYKIIAFPHHFTLFSHINNKWYFFDPDQEPEISIQDRNNKNWLGNIDSLIPAYKKGREEMKLRFGNPVNYSVSEINYAIAPNAKIFQNVTNILSRIVFLFPMLWYVYLSRKRKQTIATNNQQQTTQRWYDHFYDNERSGRRA